VVKNCKFLLLIIILGCVDTNPKSNVNKSNLEESILPIKLTLHGLYREIEDVQRSVPPVHFLIDSDSIRVTVGATERYNISYSQTSFGRIIELFKLEDFKSSDYFLNKYLGSGGILITKKKIDNEIYEKKYYGYKRGDIDVEFLPLDSIQMRNSYLLYNHTKEIALALLKDKVNKDSMQNVGSLKKALLNSIIVL